MFPVRASVAVRCLGGAQAFGYWTVSFYPRNCPCSHGDTTALPQFCDDHSAAGLHLSMSKAMYLAGYVSLHTLYRPPNILRPRLTSEALMKRIFALLLVAVCL